MDRIIICFFVVVVVDGFYKYLMLHVSTYPIPSLPLFLSLAPVSFVVLALAFLCSRDLNLRVLTKVRVRLTPGVFLCSKPVKFAVVNRKMCTILLIFLTDARCLLYEFVNK